ncbi:hypothetical protein N7493_009931 [Penicillium malachiteum]|uniref:RNase III domain-containing protein n=1 Tax=Penicillium malachiteum TaxID=1324776 RepID=A0AAD6MS06_9EURO|nr:hypothetical protein N7493_009931 [Penicillium malachiteum]
MNSKRSAPSVKNGAAEVPAKRVKVKKSSPTHQDEVPLRDGCPVEGSSCSSRLVLLERLVQNAVNDSEISTLNPEVAHALSVLNEAFNSSSAHSKHNQDSSQVSKTPSLDSSLTESKKKNSRIPTLPSIGNEQLERSVFIHPACGKQHDTSYDRLEILGDAYIELIATKLVWNRFPAISSGQISQIREGLVKNETLAKFSEDYGFDQRASVPAAFSEQPKRLLKTKGDIFEAYVAAIVLSNPRDGYQIAEKWLTSLWTPMLAKLGHQKATLRSKEELAKKIMGKGIKLEYISERDAIDEKGTGTQTFFIGVYLTGWGWEKQHLGSGSGSSKVAAGDEAARDAMANNSSLISKIAEVKKSTERSK